MLVSRDYRSEAAAGTVVLAFAAAVVASLLTGESAALAGVPVSTVALTGAVVGVALVSLYTPRPRTVTTLVGQTGRQVAIACLALGTLNVAGVAAAPDLATALVTGALLALVLPIWYGTCRRRSESQRVLVVGDDPALLEETIRSLPVAPIGFLSPALSERPADGTSQAESTSTEDAEQVEPVIVTDGGLAVGDRVDSIAGVDRLDGLSRLESVLRERDVDTVALAFEQGCREECFGVLRTCHDQGVDALAHESLADLLLVNERVGDDVVRVDLEPWPWYGRAAKRAFDIVFAAVGVVVLAPLILVIALAIKRDSPGPVLYNQTRSSELGGTFTISKFRSMVTDAESDGAQLSEADAGGVDPRVTRVGRVLRKTHMDEIPQLFSILTGEMSVVGPRPERPELDREIAADGVDWSKRWFVKPGLTGIAQINDVTGFTPKQKLAYDIEYARRQSIWLDGKLVVLQVSSVLTDVVDLATDRVGDDDRSSAD